MTFAFECVTCGDEYLSLPMPKSEPPRSVSGICEPCGRRRLGDDRYDAAVSRAIERVESGR